MAKVKFEVSGTAKPYWIAVNRDDVKITNGKGEKELAAGKEHILVWHMMGSAGESLSIVGKAGAREVVNIKESKIPPRRGASAGYRRFKV